MNKYCVTFYDEDGDLFEKVIVAINEDALMIKLDAHQYDVADYRLIGEGEMKHAKSKWEVRPSVSESVAGLTVITKDGDPVAEVYGSDIEGQKLARLFASSSELLEALKRVDEYLDNQYKGEFLPARIVQAYEVIGRAISIAEGK